MRCPAQMCIRDSLAGRRGGRLDGGLRTGVTVQRQHAQAGHDEAGVLIRRQRQFAAAVHRHRIEQLHLSLIHI